MYLKKGTNRVVKIAGRKSERLSGLGLLNSNHKLEYPLTYFDTANKGLIETYFNETLAKIRILSQKQIYIILDNASYHKSDTLKEIFKKYDCRMLFLPPYSPELNPIEQTWSHIKKHLRNHYNKDILFYENLECSILKYCA